MDKKSIQHDETFYSYGELTLYSETEVNNNLKFSIFYLILVMIVFVANLVYYNAPSYNPNNIIEDSKTFNFQSNNTFSFYKVTSRNTKDNKIFVQLELDQLLIKNFKLINMEKKLKLIFIFAGNRVNIKLHKDNSKKFDVPEYLFENSDMNLEDKNINYVEESNLGIVIINYPFNFIIYRKENDKKGEIIFDTRCNSLNNSFIYGTEEKQIYTRLPKNHFTYGLNDKSSKILLDNNATYSYSSHDHIFSIPVIVNVNPQTLNANGVLLLNTVIKSIKIEEEGITFNTGKISLYLEPLAILIFLFLQGLHLKK